MKKTSYNGFQDKEIQQIKKHILVLNNHSAKINEKIGRIETDICWIKKSMTGLVETNNRRFYWGLGLVASLLVSVTAVCLKYILA